MIRKNMPHSKTSKGKGHPLLFGMKESMMFEDFPEGGGYPKTFLEKAHGIMGIENPDEVLHLCSGSVKYGVTVDIRPEKNPTILADCRSVPLPSRSVKFILSDPPYSKDYATNLYGTGEKYPEPFEILREATRLLVDGGKIGLLHFQVPMFRKPLKLRGVWGVTTGLGYNIRAFSVFEKVAA
jgi:hypothetical protein